MLPTFWGFPVHSQGTYQVMSESDSWKLITEHIGWLWWQIRLHFIINHMHLLGVLSVKITGQKKGSMLVLRSQHKTWSHNTSIPLFNYFFCPRHSTKTRTKVWGPVQTSCANVARNSKHTVWHGMNRNSAKLLQVVHTDRASYQSVSNTNLVASRQIRRERDLTSGWRRAWLKNAFV